MDLQTTKHISVGIERSFDEVSAFLADPANFPRWAEGLGKSFRHEDGLVWSVETPMGRMQVEFTAPNPFGIADHTLVPANGARMYNPLRVVRNADGSEVIFTLFKRPGMTEEEFGRDADWIVADLRRLKNLLEG